MLKKKKIFSSLLALTFAVTGMFTFGSCGGSAIAGKDGKDGRGIQSVEYDENGDLLITFTDGATQTVKMPQTDEDQNVETTKKGKYYEAELTFFVNPSKDGTDADLAISGSYGDSVADTMLALLESELFAKQIISTMDNPPEAEIGGVVNPEYKQLLAKVQETTFFSNKATEADNRTNSLFYVTISVLNDQEFAEMLFNAIQSEMISFLETNMPIPSGYIQTKCALLTPTAQIVCVEYK